MYTNWIAWIPLFIILYAMKNIGGNTNSQNSLNVMVFSITTVKTG